MASDRPSWTIERFLLAVVLGLLAPALVGCSQKEYGSVSGKVSWQGQPVTEGTIVFSDPVWGHYRTAPINPDGTYSIKAAKTDGLLVGGVYSVTITPPRIDPPMGLPKGPPKAKPFPVPPKYQDPKTTDKKHEQTGSSMVCNVDLAP